MLPQRIIEKKNTKFWKPISPEQQLVNALRFLASGETQQSLSYSYIV